MFEFNIFKIPVRVEPIFWLTMGFIGFMLNQGQPSDQLFLRIALFIMAGFISILIHELGHALMIKKYRLPTQVVLSSFGGYATHPAGVLDRKQSFLVTLGGPLTQAIFGVALLFAYPYLGVEGNLVSYFVKVFYTVSILWAILNCVPVLPLDGGRMLESILGPKKIKLTVTISLVAAVVLCIVGFMFKAPLAGIFMAMFAFQNYQMLERLK